jgi:hypothetical protein
MANCMIQSKGLSLKYWAKVINCEIYIVNRTPKKDIKNITLKETWNNIKPNGRHFYVFGSVAWDPISYKKRKSL